MSKSYNKVCKSCLPPKTEILSMGFLAQGVCDICGNPVPGLDLSAVQKTPHPYRDPETKDPAPPQPPPLTGSR